MVGQVRGMSEQGLVRVRDVHKHFTRGGERIEVLTGVNLDVPEGRLPRLDGAIGLGKDDAAQPDGRPRLARAAETLKSTASGSAG